MATYFDSTDAEHLALLPKDWRTVSDLAVLAAQVERDVIRFYTRYVPAANVSFLTSFFGDIVEPMAVPTSEDGYYVFLRGYAPDATDASTGLRNALRDVIARVLVWRLHQTKVNPLLVGVEKAKGGTIDFEDRAGQRRFPAYWSLDLALYDTRPPSLLI